MTKVAIVVAAGRGSRAGGGVPKQWRPLGGTTVLAHSLSAFLASPGIDLVLLVLHPEDMGRGADLASGRLRLVAGGDSRAASVRNALESLAGQGVERVLIHDGARPLVSHRLIARMLAALDTHRAAAPALQVTDALWRGEDGHVAATQPRDGLWRAQTPQAFDYATILAAHRAHPGGAADDVEVARAAGIDVAIVEGEEENIKLTWPGDFARAEHILAGRDMDIRCGN
ncbi:2-C-methyl-D-erythritol 4-phosphate cytidylyltransferase, partial [Thioclava sp. BHET1]